MSFSDDEDDMLLPECVNNYHFVNEKEEPTCFSVIPFQWEQGHSLDQLDAGEKEVFLRGVTDDGLQKIYKQVTSWRLDLDGIHPEVHVLSKDKKWIKLMKPRKSFEDTIRKIMITIHCIHYLKRNQESTEKSLWDHVRKVFSHFEVRPSHSDILEHMPFIRKMIEREDISVNAELISTLLTETPKKMNAINEGLMNDKNSDFINDDDENDANTDARDDNDESDDDADGFDSVCAICDNGGDLLCCEGKCLRSFHGTKDDGKDSHCKTLGYTKAEVKAIPNFQCLNCRYNQHQCFACGNLGSSKSSDAEVLHCANVYCGRFYHPKCVAMLLRKENETEAAELEKLIAGGQKFICPFHKCIVCKKGEEKHVEELQFAMCRRCPTSYHRKCLPREISEDEERAWFDLIPHRILIYCMRHKIDERLGTPIRNHLVFPEDPMKKKVVISKLKSLAKRKAEHVVIGRATAGAATKMQKVEGDSRKRKDQATSPQHKKVKPLDIHKKPIAASKPEKNCVAGEAKVPMREKPKTLVKRELETLKSSRNYSSLPMGTNGRILSPTSTGKKLSSSLPETDKEAEKRVLALVRQSTLSSLTLESFIKTKTTPSTHVYNARQVDKSITLGKVEGSIEAIQTALQKVEEDNGSIENAKDVCEPEILEQIMKWRNKLAVYLGPFLHGLLYTSFGRHFTKVDKLKEIVDRLHWYVQSGDMIVDFCCGANDFSILMKEKLEATGKKCQYRNYDVIPPRNDFNFIKKDWMKVHSSELITGSQLIMGLNPPFGIKAALANKFIDKALEFKPKLLILIVPKETQRLDEKRGATYDLIWEDEKKLSGKAFYLPGTVDVNDKQLDQWNVQPPPLYLWSRSDWTTRHMDIAMAKGHRSKEFDELPAVEVGRDAKTFNHMEENHGPYTGSRVDGDPLTEERNRQDIGEEAAPSSRESEDFALKPNIRHDSSRLISYNRRKMCSKSVDDSAKKGSKDRMYNGKGKKSIQINDTPEGRELNESSDMSISPPREVDPRSQCDNHLPEAFEAQRETSLGISPRPSEFGMTSVRAQTTNFVADDLGNTDLYSASRREIPFSGSPLNRVTHIGDYGNEIGRSEELVKGYKRDGAFEGYSERPYGVEGRLLGQDIHPQIGTYGLQGIPDSLNSHEREKRHDIHSQVRTYVQQDVSNFPQSQERLGQDLHSLVRTYGQQDISDLPKNRYAFGSPNLGLAQVNSLATSPYRLSDTIIGTSTVDRYTPRLDEVNRGFGISGLGSSAMERYAPRLDDLNHSLATDRYAPSSQQPPWSGTVDSISFTTRPQGSFSQQGTSGWLDD